MRAFSRRRRRRQSPSAPIGAPEGTCSAQKPAANIKETRTPRSRKPTSRISDGILPGRMELSVSCRLVANEHLEVGLRSDWINHWRRRNDPFRLFAVGDGDAVLLRAGVRV